MQSEGVLVALLVAGDQASGLLVLVASIGNVLGAVINWVIGRSLDTLRVRFRIGPAPRTLARARIWYERWGRWTLLLSWAPFIGDPLTIVAGVLNERFWIFLALVTLAKVGRYIFVYAVTMGFLSF